MSSLCLPSVCIEVKTTYKCMSDLERSEKVIHLTTMKVNFCSWILDTYKNIYSKDVPNT